MTFADTLEVHAKVEGSFCENEGTPASLDYTWRLPVRRPPVIRLLRDRIVGERIVNARDDWKHGGFLTRGGSIEISVYMGGHDTAPTAAVTETWLAFLLEKAFGGYSAGAGTTIAATPGDTDTLNVASTASWAAGQMGRLGVKLDGRGDGQAFTVASVAGTPTRLELCQKMALAGAENDVVYPMMTLYPAVGTEGSMRFMVGWPESGIQYHLLGCQLESVTFDFVAGQPPAATLRYQIAYWVRYALTVPSASPAMAACSYAPVGAGSLVCATDSTRTLIAADRVTFSLATGLQPRHRLAAGVIADRAITGYDRLTTVPTLSVTKVLATADESMYDADLTSVPEYLITYTMVAVAGRALALFMPAASLVSPRPQPEDFESRLSHTLVFRGRPGAGATELITSSWRLGLG